MASLLQSRSFHAAANDLGIDGKFMGFCRKPMESFKMNVSPLRLGRQKDAYWRTMGFVNALMLHLCSSACFESVRITEITVCRKTYFEVKATKDPRGLGQELKESERHRQDLKDNDSDPLKELKVRFLKFKKQNYLENLDHYKNLAQGQSPKFMVIACADSRVCPSKILGFQPGEAFTVRNVANLVPPYQHGASETSAALEFAVNSLEVSNILVVGHSCCGGIRALMSMKQKSNSKSFIRDWVSLAKSARLSTEAAVGNLSFDEQCTHCEKESINGSLLNLLTYPWIEERVTEGVLSLHGGYYDFTNCSFEKWTLVYRQSLEGGSKFAIKGCSTWS